MTYRAGDSPVALWSSLRAGRSKGGGRPTTALPRGLGAASAPTRARPPPCGQRFRRRAEARDLNGIACARFIVSNLGAGRCLPWAGGHRQGFGSGPAVLRGAQPGSGQPRRRSPAHVLPHTPESDALSVTPCTPLRVVPGLVPSVAPLCAYRPSPLLERPAPQRSLPSPVRRGGKVPVVTDGNASTSGERSWRSSPGSGLLSRLPACPGGLPGDLGTLRRGQLLRTRPAALESAATA